MIRDIIRHLNFLRHCITPRNRRIASPKRGIVHSLTLRLVPGIKAIAREPIIPIARLSSCAIRIVPADSAVHVRAGQNPSFETVFCSLLFGVGGDVAGGYERCG
jgi:hypothetical protein